MADFHLEINCNIMHKINGNMKVLYAIQGTGNGHLSRAKEIIPALLKKKVDLDLLVSGTQAEVQIPHPVRYRFNGLSFIFGIQGGVDIWKTYLRANAGRLQKEISSLPVWKYDLVINDFEPVSAWACKLAGKPCLSLSHQAAVLAPESPVPKKKDTVGKLIMKSYAPCTDFYGFHFKSYNDHIFTPVIRADIRKETAINGDYYTVYLPSYNDQKLIEVLGRINNVKWMIFSKHNKNLRVHGNLVIRPIADKDFVRSMAGSRGILCGAGFETPAEALFLNKKLMVIPMKNQYEQHCNLAALKQLGVPSIKSLKKKHLGKIQEWVDSDTHVPVDFPDITDKIIDMVVQSPVTSNLPFADEISPV